jgi:hypothetical protein
MAVLRRTLTLSGLVLAALIVVGVPTASADLPPGGTFIDDDGSVHEGSIEAIYAAGITVGCDERGIRFCPNDEITRGEVAVFLARALGLPASSTDHFSDDNGHTFESAINRIADASITLGCNPPSNTHFCPNRSLSRAEMATLIVRAFPDEVPADAPDAFTDDGDSVHQSNINRIAAANITLGCNPPANDRYCPRDRVTRAQMATFMTRALGLTATKPPPQKPIERVSSFTTFYDCCQNRVTNIQTMARAVDGYVVMPGEMFSIDRVVGPRTSAKGYVPAPYLVNGEGACCAVGGGVSQFGTTIHNAVFWGGYQIDRHQPHSGWISRYPLGIEATLVYNSIDFRFTNDTTTPVYIRTSYTSTSITVELWGNQGGWQMRGQHPRGARSSSITVLDRGGSDAKRVSATVTGSAPGTVRVTRTLTRGGVSTSQSWWWNYVS